MSFTVEEKLACATRELKMRRRVYARLASERKMSPEQCAHEIACMEAIVADYEELVKKERLV